MIEILNLEYFKKNNEKKISPNFFDTCKKFISRLVTKSEGWIYSTL